MLCSRPLHDPQVRPSVHLHWLLRRVQWKDRATCWRTIARCSKSVLSYKLRHRRFRIGHQSEAYSIVTVVLREGIDGVRRAART